MTFDPMRGPSAIAQGSVGEVRIGGLLAGRLTAWRVVMSPTTDKPTLFGEGTFLRYFKQAVGVEAVASLTPTPPPYRIGRPKPRAGKPFTLTGTVFELTAGRITISEGSIEHAHG